MPRWIGTADGDGAETPAPTHVPAKCRGRVGARPQRRLRAHHAVLAAIALTPAFIAPATALERIGVVAPLEDRHSVLGEQVVEGARLALGVTSSPTGPGGEAAGNGDDTAPADGTTPTDGADGPDGSNGADASVPTPPVEPEGTDTSASEATPDAPSGGGASTSAGKPELVVIPDPCRGGENGEADGATVAERVREADIDALVGFICWSTLEAALDADALGDVPILTSGVRAGRLTDARGRNGWNVWRIAPRVDDEAEAIVDVILSQWRGRPFAILDDGTIYGRELAESVSVALGERGVEPILADTFRPAVSRQFGLVRRIQSSGATRVFIAGERRDVAIISRDAVEAGLPIGVLGGDVLRAVEDDVPLAIGVEATVLEPALATGYRDTTRAAVEVLLEANRLSGERDVSLEQALAEGEFDTAIGPVRFDSRGDMDRNLFVHARWDGRRWVPFGAAVPEEPSEDGPTEGTDAADGDGGT